MRCPASASAPEEANCPFGRASSYRRPPPRHGWQRACSSRGLGRAWTDAARDAHTRREQARGACALRLLEFGAVALGARAAGPFGCEARSVAVTVPPHTMIDVSARPDVQLVSYRSVLLKEIVFVSFSNLIICNLLLKHAAASPRLAADGRPRLTIIIATDTAEAR